MTITKIKEKLIFCNLCNFEVSNLIRNDYINKVNKGLRRYSYLFFAKDLT